MNRTRHRSDVSFSSRRDSNTHRETIPLRHADPGEHSPASMIRHRCSRSRSALTTLCLRDIIVVPPLVREGKRRSHIRRDSTLPLLVLLLAALPLLPLETEKESGTSLKRRRRNTLNHVRPNVRRSTRGRGVLLHLLLCLLQFLQTLLLLFREVQPGRSLELILGLLLRLMTILTPLLGLRVRRHTGIISVYLWIMMTNLIRILKIIRT